MRSHHTLQVWRGCKGAGLAAAGGYLNVYLANTSPALIPLGVAASYWLSKGVEGPQDSRQRWMMVAGSVACAATALAAPQWAPLVVAGQSLLQGLAGAGSARTMTLPQIPTARLKEQLLAANPQFSNAEQLLAQMRLPDLLESLESIYKQEIRPEHLQSSQTLHELRRPDESARSQVESLLQTPFPGRVYTYRQRAMGDSPGVAAGAELGLSKEFLNESDKVTKCYVVGHEYSHLKNQDILLALAAESLMEMAGDRWSLEEVDRALTPHFHAMELRADREGADLALRHGATPTEIMDTVQNLLGGTPRSESHPSGYERLRALDRHLRGFEGK